MPGVAEELRRKLGTAMLTNHVQSAPSTLPSHVQRLYDRNNALPWWTLISSTPFLSRIDFAFSSVWSTSAMRVLITFGRVPGAIPQNVASGRRAWFKVHWTHASEQESGN